MTKPEKKSKEIDSSFRVETPEGIEYTLYPAGLCARFCAYGIDNVFQWLLLIVFYASYYIVLNAAGGIWIILLFRFALNWFYHVFFDLFFGGQSPGKRIFGLRVVCSDGSPINPGASFIRNLLRFVDGFMGLYLLAFLCAVYSPAFRRPGDWAAGTLVIYSSQRQIPQNLDLMKWLDGFNPVLPKRILTYEEKQGILMFSRRYPLLGIARSDEIAAPLVSSLQNEKQEIAGASNYLLGIARSFAGDS